MKRIALALGMAFTLCSPAALSVPMFTNNSFESGFTGWVSGGSPDIQSFGFDGSRSVAGAVFSGGSNFETISQVVSGFTVGQSYTLSFYQQNNGRLLNPYDDGRASWEVLIDSVSSFFSGLMDPGETTWTQQSFDFVASSTSLDFMFKPFDIDNGAALPGDTGVYPVLDLIELAEAGDPPSPAPVPATLALLGLGWAGLWWSRRKKA